MFILHLAIGGLWFTFVMLMFVSVFFLIKYLIKKNWSEAFHYWMVNLTFTAIAAGLSVLMERIVK